MTNLWQPCAAGLAVWLLTVVCVEGCSMVLDSTCENGTTTLKTASNITEDFDSLKLQDCEGGLYNESGVLLSDAPPFGKAEMSKLIKEATFWNLTIASCPPVIYWRITCTVPVEERKYGFQACYKKTGHELISYPDDGTSNHRHWLLLLVPLAVLVVMVLIGALC